MTEKILPKDVQDLLNRLGVPEGQWSDVAEHTVQPPLIRHQAETLIRLRTVLEGLLAQDQASLAQLHEQLVRLKHGGGS